MQILDWRPAKPPRVTRAIGRAVDRATREFTNRTGRWPRTGILYLDPTLQRIERVEFEPEVAHGA